MYRQAIDSAGISLEQGTGNVPDDKKYYVVCDGQVQKGFRSLRQAQQQYAQLVKERAPAKIGPAGPTPAERLQAELASAPLEGYWGDDRYRRIARAKNNRTRTYR